MTWNEVAELLPLIPVGIAAGFINVTAGGGSLLSLPVLMMLGLSPALANGTNRIAILIQNISAVTRLHQLKVIPYEITLITAIPAVIGAIVGAQIAVEIDEVLFKRLLALVMVMVLCFMIFKPSILNPPDQVKLKTKTKWLLVPSFFLIGIYGGFIQGGVGFLLIAALALAGYDLVRTNALKLLVVLCFTPFALGVFILNDQVNYLYGLVLAIGNATGGWLASNVMVAKGHAFTRRLVIAAMIVFAIRLVFAD